MSKKETASKKVTKKQARSIVYDKLSGALAEYKGSVKPKKFETHLKKASKLFAEDIAKASGKKNNDNKKAQKKKPNKKSTQAKETA
jgi:hypothetical protein